MTVNLLKDFKMFKPRKCWKEWGKISLVELWNWYLIQCLSECAKTFDIPDWFARKVVEMFFKCHYLVACHNLGLANLNLTPLKKIMKIVQQQEKYQKRCPIKHGGGSISISYYV